MGIVSDVSAKYFLQIEDGRLRCQTSLVLISETNPEMFRGPELSPGDDVQTDEQLDAFVRHIAIN